MIYYGIALLVLAIDRFSKLWIVENLSYRETRPVLGEFFQITSHRNAGAAFGILQNQRWFFVCLTVIVVVGLVWYMTYVIRSKKRLLPVALALILGGAVGNFVDRALTGEVVDFFQVTFNFDFFGKHIDYIYPIFNVADSAIVIGVILVFVDTLFLQQSNKPNPRNGGNDSVTAQSNETQPSGNPLNSPETPESR